MPRLGVRAPGPHIRNNNKRKVVSSWLCANPPPPPFLMSLTLAILGRFLFFRGCFFFVEGAQISVSI